MEGDQHVAGSDTREVRRAARHDGHDLDAGPCAGLPRDRILQRDLRTGDAQPAAAHSPLAHEGVHDLPARRVHGHGEAQPGSRDGGVHTDHAGRTVGERSTAVPGVEGGVGLDDLVDHPPGAGRQRATERRHDPGRHASCQAERIADRDHELPDLKCGGVAQLDRWRRGVVGFQDREVGQRVAPDDPRPHAGSVPERQVDARRALDDVRTGQEVSLGRDDRGAAEAHASSGASGHGCDGRAHGGGDAHDHRGVRVQGAGIGIGIGIRHDTSVRVPRRRRGSVRQRLSGTAFPTAWSRTFERMF